MSWFRLDDNWLTHPKHRAAGKDGRSLWVAGGTHCAQQLTDGVIDKASVPLIAATAEVRPSLAKKLVEVGLWDDMGDHFLVHDFLEFNRSREQVLAERDRWKRSKKKSREESTRDTDEEATEESSGASTLSRPDPSRTEESSSSSDHSAAVDNSDDDRFEAVLRMLAEGKAQHGDPKGPAWFVTTMNNDRRSQGKRIDRLLAAYPDAPTDALVGHLRGEVNTLASYRKSA